jgi:hypothetical protein
MRPFKVPGGAPDTHLGFSRTEKRRLMWLSIGLFLVVIAVAIGTVKARGARDAEEGDFPELVEALPQEAVDLPEIDVARIEELVRDKRDVDRVLLDGEAVAATLAVVRALTPQHFEAMGTLELDQAVIETIVADPAAARMDPFLVRGWVESVRTRRPSLTSPDEHICRIVLEDDSIAYALTLEMPEGFIDGDFIRLDGLFLKVYKDEKTDESGTWIEGPLIVGPRAIRSYRDLGQVAKLDELRLLPVVDDVLVNPDGTPGEWTTTLPFEPLWYLMAYARDLPGEAIDWENAPLVDQVMLDELYRNGAAYRGQPFRFPISRLQHSTVKRAGENPARIEHFTEGWIGNVMWKNVVYFKAPFENREARLRDYATARGFFLKNFTYESSRQGLRVAPLFVLQSVTIIDPDPDPVFRIIAYGMAGFTLLAIVFFFFALLRDKARARALQGQLVQRRRARQKREQDPSSTSATPS